MKTLSLLFALFLSTNLTATSSEGGHSGHGMETPPVPEYEDSLNRAKELNAKLSQISNTDLARDLKAWTDYWVIIHATTAEQVVAMDITSNYTLTALVNDLITKEESILLTRMFQRLPVYGDFKLGFELSEIKAIERMELDIDVAKVIFSDEDSLFYINQSMRIKRHWLKARGLFKLALRR